MKLALTALAALAVVSLSAGPADAKVRPINEGGDTRPCVTYDESMAVLLGMPMHRVQRVLDTPGRRAGGQVIAAVADLVGNRARKDSLFRTYPLCDGEPGTMVVEFSGRTDLHRVVSAYYG